MTEPAAQVPVSRPSWAAMAAALVALAALYIHKDYVVLPMIAVALVAVYPIRLRLPGHPLLVWPIRAILFIAIIMTSGNRRISSQTPIWMSGDYVNLFGYFCAAELLIQAWQKRKHGVGHGEMLVLSAMVLAAATNTFSNHPDYRWVRYLCPIYVALATISLRDFRPRHKGGGTPRGPMVVARHVVRGDADGADPRYGHNLGAAIIRRQGQFLADQLAAQPPGRPQGANHRHGRRAPVASHLPPSTLARARAQNRRPQERRASARSGVRQVRPGAMGAETGRTEISTGPYAPVEHGRRRAPMARQPPFSATGPAVSAVWSAPASGPWRPANWTGTATAASPCDRAATSRGAYIYEAIVPQKPRLAGVALRQNRPPRSGHAISRCRLRSTQRFAIWLSASRTRPISAAG